MAKKKPSSRKRVPDVNRISPFGFVGYSTLTPLLFEIVDNFDRVLARSVLFDACLKSGYLRPDLLFFSQVFAKTSNLEVVRLDAHQVGMLKRVGVLYFNKSNDTICSWIGVPFFQIEAKSYLQVVLHTAPADYLPIYFATELGHLLVDRYNSLVKQMIQVYEFELSDNTCTKEVCENVQ